MQDTSLVSDYNLEEGCKVHLILQKEVLAPGANQASTSSSSFSNATTTTAINTAATKACPMETADRNCHQITNVNTTANTSDGQQNDVLSCNHKQSRFEVILRERLARHFPPDSVEKIMIKLQHEINADINSSSLDDLERLAKQKLNISNE